MCLCFIMIILFAVKFLQVLVKCIKPYVLWGYSMLVDVNGIYYMHLGEQAH